MGRSIACIDYRNGKIFIAKRQNIGVMGNRWEFPGGKLEDGEDYETAIKREMIEEFSVNVQVGEKIASASFEHNGKAFVVDAYIVKFEHDGMEKPFVLTEHTEYKWADISEIPNLNFVDSDLKLYPQILKYFNLE